MIAERVRVSGLIQLSSPDLWSEEFCLVMQAIDRSGRCGRHVWWHGADSHSHTLFTCPHSECVPNTHTPSYNVDM